MSYKAHLATTVKTSPLNEGIDRRFRINCEHGEHFDRRRYLRHSSGTSGRRARSPQPIVDEFLDTPHSGHPQGHVSIGDIGPYS